MTYNVSLIFPDHSSIDRANKIRGHIIRGNYDLVGLCEVYSPLLRDILVKDVSLERSYPYRIFGLKKFGTVDNGTVLLSKHPLKNIIRREYPNHLSSPLNSLLPPKDVIFAIMNYIDVEVGVFLTHLQWGNYGKYPKIRRDQINYLSSLIDEVWDRDRPFIVLGDLNIYERSGDRDHLLAALGDVQDWYDLTNDVDQDPGYTWDLQNYRILYYYTEERFDYILSNKFIRPLFTSVLKLKDEDIEEDLDIGELPTYGKIFYWSTKVIQILILPVYLLLRGLDWIIKYKKGIIRSKEADLSDHYALVGEGELEISILSEMI